MDKKGFSKGHDDVPLMTDIDGQRVLEVAPGRTKEAPHSLWKTLSDEQETDVDIVLLGTPGEEREGYVFPIEWRRTPRDSSPLVA